MKKPGKRTLIATSGVILLAGGASAAAAAVLSPVGSDGMINGCYTNAAVNGSHVLVLQDAGTSCPKGTTPISWNQSGAAGPAGAPAEAAPNANRGTRARLSA